MTNLASKGGLRAAATARRNRHTQTEPLPPRPQSVEDAKFAIAMAEKYAPETKPMGQMTVAELRDYAASVGLDHDADGKKITTRTPKGRLLTGILNWERNREDRAAQERGQREQDAIPQDEDSPSGPYSPKPLPTGDAPMEVSSATAGASSLDAKGSAKAAALQGHTDPYGWKMRVQGEGTMVRAVLSRGAEVLHVEWDAGVFVYESATYAIGDRVTKIRNVSQARQIAARDPQEASKELARVAANRSYRPREPKGETQRSKLPFDPREASDQQIIESLLGRGVRWLNRLSNSVEQAVVTREPRLVEVKTGPDGDRLVQFLSVSSGFRAFRLENLLSVTGSSARKRKARA